MGERGTGRQGDMGIATLKKFFSSLCNRLTHSPALPFPRSPTLPVYAAILLLIFVLAPQHAVGAEPETIPSLSPQDVVRIQLEALRADRIDIVFKFASPRNKAHTGPLSRFVGMLKSPTYAAMLNHRAVVYGPFRKESGQAFQTVILIPPEARASVMSLSCQSIIRTPAMGVG